MLILFKIINKIVLYGINGSNKLIAEQFSKNGRRQNLRYHKLLMFTEAHLVMFTKLLRLIDRT